MKHIFSGNISLSFLSIPVSLGSRTKDSGPELHQARRQSGSPIKYKRVTEDDFDGPEVPYRDVVKSYAAPDGSLVLIEPDELKFKYDKNVRIVSFTDASEVPPLAAKSAYWVEPAKGGEKAYALLASSLQSSGKVAIVNFAMRENMAVAVLRAVDGYLAVEPLEFDSDLIRPDFAAPANTATLAEQELMFQMIDGMSAKYDHSAQADVTAEAKMALIQGKIERGEVRPAPARPDNTGAPVNLEAQLRAAVDAAKSKTAAVPKARRAPQRKAAA